jgi:hypothetical protein
MVIGLAAAGREETVAAVKGEGGEVGFAEFEKDAGDGGTAEFIDGGEKEGGGYAFAAKIAVDGNIEDFRFVGDLTGGQEAGGPALCFAH